MLFRDVDGRTSSRSSKTQTVLSSFTSIFLSWFSRKRKHFRQDHRQYVILGFGLGVIALTLLLWPVAAILRRHYGKPLTLESSCPAHPWILRIVCALNIFSSSDFHGLSGLKSPEASARQAISGCTQFKSSACSAELARFTRSSLLCLLGRQTAMGLGIASGMFCWA